MFFFFIIIYLNFGIFNNMYEQKPSFSNSFPIWRFCVFEDLNKQAEKYLYLTDRTLYNTSYNKAIKTYI